MSEIAALSKAKVRKAVGLRDGEMCAKCHCPGPGLELHRLHPGRDGGTYTVNNCRLLCRRCHGEWTWVMEDMVEFEQWLMAPPAAILLRVLLDGDPEIAGAPGHQFLAEFSSQVRAAMEAAA